VRFGLKQRNQVFKWKKVRCKIIRLFGKLLMEVFTERGIAALSESTHCTQGQPLVSVATRGKARTRGVSGHGRAGCASRGPGRGKNLNSGHLAPSTSGHRWRLTLNPIPSRTTSHSTGHTLCRSTKPGAGSTGRTASSKNWAKC